MNRYNEILKKVKSTATPADIVGTRAFSGYVQVKANGLTDSWGIAGRNLHMEVGGVPYVACTNGRDLYLNMGHEMFKQLSVEELLRAALGLTFHELLHVGYTDFTLMPRVAAAIESGNLYPALPMEYGANKIKALISMPNYGKAFAHLYAEVLNILEDGRIEVMGVTYEEEQGTLIGGLNFMRNLMKEEAPSYSELVEKWEKGELHMFEVLTRMLLDYIRERSVKGLDNSCDEIRDEFEKLVPFAEKFRVAVNSDAQARAINELFCVSSDIVTDYIQKMAQDQQSQDGQSDGQSSGQGQGQSQGSGQGSGQGQGQNPGQGQGQAQDQGQGQGQGAPTQDLTDDELSNAERNISDSMGDIAQSERPENQYGEGCLNGANCPKGGRSAGSGMKTETVSQKDLIQQALEELAADKAIRGIKNPTRMALRTPRWDQWHADEYKRRYERISPLVRKATSEVKIKNKDEFVPREKKNQFSGSKFRGERSYRPDLKHFSKRNVVPDEPFVMVSVVTDMSGSMGGSREDAAVDTMIFLREYCKKIGVPFSAYSYNSWEIFLHVDAEVAAETEKYRITTADAGGGTPTEEPLVFTAQRMREQEASFGKKASKLIFMITDGEPGGDPREITKEIAKISREKFYTVGVGIGEDKKILKEIFGERNFIDISRLDKLPSELSRVIRQFKI